MSKVNLPPIPGGYLSLGAVNTRFADIEAAFNNTLSRDGSLPNSMEADLDMDSNLILNIGFDPDNPNSLIPLGEADDRYVNRTGDSMLGAITVLAPVGATEPVQKQQLDATIAGYQAGDANLQAQISGGAPLEASAFSPISWHAQTVENSVTIPEDKNAWSFGPTLDIAPGAGVTISEGSFWTIANGDGENLINPDQGVL